MKLTILGCSPSFPNPGGASSGYVLESGGTKLLLECGHGVSSRLPLFVAPATLHAILVTHMHADHFLDLVPLAYLLHFRDRPARPIPVFLPPGGKDTWSEVTALLGPESGMLDEVYDPEEYDVSSKLTIGPMNLTFAPTAHFVPGLAVRARDILTDAEFGFSSDTGPSANVARLLHGVALALVEATELETPGRDPAHGHLSGRQAGELAKAAGVERLLLTHYASFFAEAILEEAQSAFTRPCELAQPGSQYEVGPPGSVQ